MTDTWKGILYGTQLLHKGFRWRVATGDNISFWFGGWTGVCLLSDVTYVASKVTSLTWSLIFIFILAEGSLEDLLPYDIHCKYKCILVVWISNTAIVLVATFLINLLRLTSFSKQTFLPKNNSIFFNNPKIIIHFFSGFKMLSHINNLIGVNSSSPTFFLNSIQV